MNILFVGQTFPDADAPVRGTFNLALCRELARAHEVRVISPRTWTERLATLRQGKPACRPSQEVEEAGIRTAYPICWHLPRIALHRAGIAMARSVRRGLQEIARDFRPDAVLSYWAHPDGRAALEVARDLNVPSACIVGGSDVLLVPHYTRKRRLEVLRVLCESDAVITVSEGLRQAAIELGAPGERVHAIHQGINPALFYPGDQESARKRLRLTPHVPLYLWVGRIVEVKRLDLLLRAAAALRSRGFRFRLAIVGDGPLAPKMKRLAASLNLENVAEFFGPVRQDRLAVWHHAADAVVLSSRSEGLPNVFREALACGRPFVSTDVGSVREIALPEVSMLAPPNDVEALADAMQEIVQSAFREAALRHVSRTWSDCAADVSDLLTLLSGNWGRASVQRFRERERPARCAEPAAVSASSFASGPRREIFEDLMNVTGPERKGAR
jgi:glycosyltransferase involved in cell wall biosynthesis